MTDLQMREIFNTFLGLSIISRENISVLYFADQSQKKVWKKRVDTPDQGKIEVLKMVKVTKPRLTVLGWQERIVVELRDLIVIVSLSSYSGLWVP